MGIGLPGSMMTDIAELGLRIRADGAREAATDLDRVSTSAKRATQAARPLANSVGTTGRAMSRLGPQVQNASFQVADFAVQVSAGTSATRAFAQQAPQLLGGFGAFGAAAGAAVAVGAALVPVLFNLGAEAQTAEDAIDGLADAVDVLNDAMRASQSPITDLIDQYGQFTGRALEVLEIQRRIAQLDAASALAATTEQVSRMFDQFGNISRVVDPLGVSNFDRAVDEIVGTMKIGEDQARLFLTQLERLAEARGPEAQAEALRNVREQLEVATSQAGNMNAEARSFLSLLTDAETAALRVAAVDIASGIGAAASNAQGLADQLKRAAHFKNQFGSPDPSVGNETLTFGDNPGGNGRRRIIDLREPSLSGGGGAQSGASIGGGGGGGISEAERELDRFRQSLGRFRTEEQQAAHDLEEFERAVGTFRDSLSDRELILVGQGLEELRDRMSGVSEGAERLREGLSQTFASIVTGAQSAGEAISNLASRFADMLAQQGFDMLIGAAFPSIFPSAKGNAFAGGNVVPFARGGIVSGPTLFPMANGAGLMGEAGPEAIMPLKRTGGGQLGVRSEPQLVRVVIDAGPEFNARVIEGAAQVVRSYDRRVAPRRQAEIARDPRARVG